MSSNSPFPFSRWIAPLLLLLFLIPRAPAQVPPMIHYQGRVLANGTAFDGAGQFKFALVNANASVTYWRNAADANSDGEPDTAVSIPTTRGLYSVLLGDTSLANMLALPNNLFTNSAVYLRVWFTDGQVAFERLVPDQRLVAVGYAMIAANVADGVISLSKLAPDALGAIQNAASNARADALQSQIAALTARLDGLSLSNLALPSGLTASSTDSADATLIAQGFSAFNSTTPSPWINGPTQDAPSSRYAHTAVWTGDSWIIWGGNLGGVLSDVGSIYRRSNDTWSLIPTLGAPEARSEHTAIWTGQEMIVWGGFSAGQYLNTGGRFSVGGQWSPTSTGIAPPGRLGHVAVWTGSRMLIWGGRNGDGLLNTGALYDPSTDQWSVLAVANPPEARQDASYVLAGNQLVIWGGSGAGGALNNGARLQIDGNGIPIVWNAISSTSAPSARVEHTMVWTGQRALVWGGKNGGTFLGDGAAYNPANDTWQPISSTSTPSARAEHGAAWTGTEMIIVNGDSAGGALATGAAYNLATDRWRALANGGSPAARFGGATAWTGSEILVFGGRASGSPIAVLQRVNPQPAWTFYRKP